MRVQLWGQMREVVEVRACDYCKEPESVVRTTHHRSQRYCSRECARKGMDQSKGRQRAAKRRWMRDIQDGPLTIERMVLLYERAYNAGYKAGRSTGASEERRRLIRIAIKARKLKEAA